ncbi:MAG: hypothetical protein ABJE47_17845 [bacterium]
MPLVALVFACLSFALTSNTGSSLARSALRIADTTPTATRVGTTRLPPRADTLVLRLDVRPLPPDSTPRVEIRLTLPASKDSVCVLHLPDEWAGQRSLHENIRDLTTITTGARLEPGADSAHRRLVSPPGREVAISWIRRPSWKGQMPIGAHNVSDFGPDWMQLVGYDALVLPARDQSTPMRGTIVFRGLSRGSVVATSFGSGIAPADTLFVIHATLGVLQHAVYSIGTTPGAIRLHRVSAGRHPVDVAIRGALAIPDSELVAGVRRIVAAERGFWNDDGPRAYLVTIGEATRGTLAGTRLTNSFVADIDPTRAAADEGVLSLLGHELMHDWIGGKLQPAPTQADGHLGWFTEGFTEYLSLRVLWRAGIFSDAQYVAHVNRWLGEYATSSARDLPWNEVERRYWSDPTVQRQPYLRGALFALRLNALASSQSLQQTVDGALARMMTANHGKPVALTPASIAAGLSGVIGATAATREVSAMMEGGRMAIPNDLLGSCLAQTEVDQPRWDAGFDLDGSLPSRVVRGVRAGSRAARAGLEDGMQLRGVSVYRGDISKPVELRVRSAADTAIRPITYDAFSDVTDRVTVLALKNGCRPS